MIRLLSSKSPQKTTVQQMAEAQNDLAVEMMFWQSILQDPSPTVASYEAYIQAYPQGRFAALAQIKINADRNRLAAVMTGADIVALVAKQSHLTVKEIISEQRARRISLVRWVAMALMREFTTLSLPAIGRVLGNRDHTTIHHGLHQIKLMETGELKNLDTVPTLNLLAKCRSVLSPSPTNGHIASAQSQP